MVLWFWCVGVVVCVLPFSCLVLRWFVRDPAWLWLCMRCGLVCVQVVQQWCRSVGRCFLSLLWIGV